MLQRSDFSRMMDSYVYVVPGMAHELSQANPVLRFFYNSQMQGKEEAKAIACDFVRSHNIQVLEVVQTPRDRAESQHSAFRTYFTVKGKAV